MQGNDFVESVMFHNGVVCSTCHDVHGTNNPAQLRKPGMAMCATCHATKANFAHTKHRDGSTGSDCLACHMPKIEKTIADVNVRAHTFEFITPAMTDKFGIPNPCTSCHQDKTTAWATASLAHAAH
jgi:predicted CXXCH cytochrome family protein